jgi:phasin family protein
MDFDSMADKFPVKGKSAPVAKAAMKAPVQPKVAKAVEPAAAKSVDVVPAPVVPAPILTETISEVAASAPVAVAAAPVIEAIPSSVVKVAKATMAKAKSASAALPPKSKGTVMATTIPPQPKAAAEKVKLMITEFNDRAKTAFEKSVKAGEELTEFTKGNMEALAASAKTAAKGAETLGQELADYGKKSFETASATMKSLAAVKTPTEMFQIQSDYAKSSFDSAVAEASKFSEAWLKLAGEVFQPISSRYALAAEKIKTAAL